MGLIQIHLNGSTRLVDVEPEEPKAESESSLRFAGLQFFAHNRLYCTGDPRRYPDSPVGRVCKSYASQKPLLECLKEKKVVK